MTPRPTAPLFLIVSLFACTGRTGAPPGSSAVPSIIATHPVVTVQPTAAITVAAGNVTPITAESTPAPRDRPVYQIDAVLDTNIIPTESGGVMQLTVREQVTYTHHAQTPAGELVLQFEPSRRPELFFLEGVSADRAARDGRAEIRDGQLRIELEQPLSFGESVVLRLEYRRHIAREPELIGWNDLQILLGNWYAFFPPYREGAGWLAHTPGKAGEYLNYAYADFDVRLEIRGDESYQAAASGAPEAGAPPLHYLFTGRSFAFALTKQALFSRAAGEVEIRAYARPEYAAQGNAMADTAAQAIGFYSERLGDYPHRLFTVLESDLYDGMEFDGLVFLSPALFEYFAGDGKDYLTAITAHEAVHQWWYGRVGNDQAMEPWLDEAFAVYSELLFYEKFHPGNLDWWWWTRVDRYPSSECVDQPVYAFPDFRSYVNAVYLRGAKMLHSLRLRMGNAAFADSQRDLQAAYFGLTITSADVFRVFQSHAAVPLSAVWEEFLCQPVPPEAE
jgi:hypothetical protein